LHEYTQFINSLPKFPYGKRLSEKSIQTEDPNSIQIPKQHNWPWLKHHKKTHSKIKFPTKGKNIGIKIQTTPKQFTTNVPFCIFIGCYSA